MDKIIYICGCIFLLFLFVAVITSIHFFITFPTKWRKDIQGRLENIERLIGK